MQARARLGRQLTGPLVIRATFYVRRPKRPKYPYPRLDCDKLARGLLDGICENGKLVENDAQFVRLEIEKRYTVREPGCATEISDA